MSEARSDVQQVLDDARLLDQLAAAEHERWAHWQQYLHEQCLVGRDGSLVIPAELVKRWTEQVNTSFSELTEAEKESDRDQVRRYLPIIREAFRRAGIS